MKMQPNPTDREVLAGLVERVAYQNAENGFCVIRVKARSHRDLVTLVGHAATILAGEWITASGDWVNDRIHGQQFRARFLKTSEPTSLEGIEKYLASGMIRGIGPVYAKKLLRAFGDKVFDVIETQPARLREVDGIGPVRAARIVAGWAEQKAVREIMVFLHSHGVGTARAVRIFKTYGTDAIQIMTENPYRLARDIRGIGFKTADDIAMKLGIEKTAMVRVRAGISYALTEAMDEGHCGLPTEELGPLAEKLLEVPQDLIRAALDLELREGTVIADRVGETPCMFLAGLYRAERTIAERLLRLANGNPLDCDLLVVDETSMVDVMLMQSLMKAVPDKAALLLVGDIDQLPSVGPGQVLADVISSGAVPVVRLTEVFRQAARSRIITSAHRINQGGFPDLSPPGDESDFYFVQADDPETAVGRIIELVKTRIPRRFGFNPIRDIQVLCPMNRGGVGARSLNIELQAALNPAGDRKVERFGWTFAPGDKVMQIENDYDKEVYNGDIGFVTSVEPDEGELTASFDDRPVTYSFGELDTLVPAYAATIHKSQGSEYPAVVIPVMTQHYAMLQRNLLYTGVIRGKRLAVLVGQKKAVAIAVRNVSGRRRWSKLAEWLRPSTTVLWHVSG